MKHPRLGLLSATLFVLLLGALSVTVVVAALPAGSAEGGGSPLAEGATDWAVLAIVVVSGAFLIGIRMLGKHRHRVDERDKE